MIKEPRFAYPSPRVRKIWEFTARGGGGELALFTRIFCAVMKMRTAALNRSTSKTPSSRLNFIRLSDARLQAVLSRKTYSEQGLVEWIGWVPLQVCHFWMAPSYCKPGSPQIQVPSAILFSRTLASFFCRGLPVVTERVHQSLCSKAARMKSSLALTERFSF